jgi:hypothetical protein
MVAIVTTDTKQLLVEKLIDDLQADSNNYYLGIGKTDVWNVTDTAPSTIVDAETTKRDFRNNLQSVQKISSVSFVAKRYNWSSGTIYQPYRDTQNSTGNGQYYVITQSNRVYICLRQGRDVSGNINTSTVDPDTTGTTTSPVKTSDGYVWKFLFTESATRLNSFATSNFIPVEKITASAGLSNIQQSQKDVQDAASSGQIVGYLVNSGGTGFTSAPTITVSGNGSNARAVATVASGTIVAVNVDDSAGGFPFGAGYDNATVTVGGSGSGAVVKPIISSNGIGADPRDDLKSSSIMFNSKIVGEAGSGDFLVGTGADFRQVGILKNPKIPTSRSAADSDFTATTGSALKILTLNNGSGLTGLDVDDIMSQVQASVTAKAYVNKITGTDSDATVLYHQNDNTGFVPFLDGGDAIKDSAEDTTVFGDFVSDSDGEVDPYSGNLLYVENRAAVERTTAGTEDIKITIQF